MLIKVMYQNNEYGTVNPFLLDELIASGKIKKFLRSEGWATIGIDPIREQVVIITAQKDGIIPYLNY
jgi:hypothetical protein